MTEPIKLLGTYARVSTSKQEEEKTIENYLMTYKEFAEKNNYKIVKEYNDEGWSGDILARPALDELRQDAKKKIWDAVLIYDPDRLARRYSYQELVLDELREAGIEVIFITVSTPKNPEDKILHGVRGLFAEYERAKITERFRLGKLRKVKEGHVLTTEAPYGYTYIRGNKEQKTHGYYVINEEEARIVRMIFSWVANRNMTIREVIRQLKAQDIKPKKSKRGVWSTTTLSNMFRNKSYIGEAHWGASYAVIPEKPIKIEKYKKMKKTSRKIKPEEEWIASKIPVPKIIEPELFMRVQEQLKRNYALCDRNKKNQYLLAGTIKCICGRTRGGEGPQHGKHLYYRCNDRNYSFPLPPTCHEKGINARAADKIVWDRVYKFMSSPNLLSAQANHWLNSKKDKTKSSVLDIKDLEKELDKLKAQEDRYNKAYGAGALTLEQLKEYNTPVRGRIASLEMQIIKARQEENQINTEAIPTQEEILRFTKMATERLINLNFETKRVIIRKIFDKVVGSQQNLEVHGSLPITDNYVEFKTINRNCWPPECR